MLLAAGNVCSLQSFVHRGSGVNHSGQLEIKTLISTGVDIDLIRLGGLIGPICRSTTSQCSA